MRPRRRGGFTLIEFLVLVAILALLLGLLLPAVQKIRTVADRARCQDNLRGVGLAFTRYHDARGHFPRGGRYGSGSCRAVLTAPRARESDWTWAYQILPHLGQDDLHRNPSAAVVRGTPVGAFYCPARRPAVTYHGLAKIDYAGNAGDHPEGLTGLVMRGDHGAVRMIDVTDGLGCTVMVAEKQLNRSMLGRSADDDESHATAGWEGDWEVYRWGLTPPARDTAEPGNPDPSSAFGSAHPAGFNCGFADGSVRFIRYSVTPATWRRACVRNDNQMYNQGDF